jgi:hypothetical protein
MFPGLVTTDPDLKPKIGTATKTGDIADEDIAGDENTGEEKKRLNFTGVRTGRTQ